MHLDSACGTSWSATAEEGEHPLARGGRPVSPQQESHEMRTTETTPRANGLSPNPSPSIRPVRRPPHPSATPLFTLFLLAGFVLTPRVANAGSITYTWNEDDGQNVTGQLVVSSAAQTAGAINLADITSFSFGGEIHGFPFEFTLPYVIGSFPIPISMSDAAPTSASTQLKIGGPFAPNGIPSIVTLDHFYNVTNHESWNLQTESFLIYTGSGHWTITTAGGTVPEPSTVVLAAVAAVCGLAYGWCRPRWNRGGRRHFCHLPRPGEDRGKGSGLMA
jgi:hypothetical protein